MTSRKMKGHWWVDFRYERRRIRKRSPVDTKRGAEEYERLLRQRLLQGLDLNGHTEEEAKQEIPTFEAFARSSSRPTSSPTTSRVPSATSG